MYVNSNQSSETEEKKKLYLANDKIKHKRSQSTVT